MLEARVLAISGNRKGMHEIIGDIGSGKQQAKARVSENFGTLAAIALQKHLKFEFVFDGDTVVSK